MSEYCGSRNRKQLSREAIIGLGEDSIRKNYYPELQDRLMELERINIRNRFLIATIPDILLVSDSNSHISPFAMTTKVNPFILEILRNDEVMKSLRNSIQEAREKRELITNHFSILQSEVMHYFEARIQVSDFDEAILMIRDITEHVLMENQLRDMAERDSLTNLFNRRIFEKKLSSFRGKEFKGLSLLLLDIDGLKMVNDTLGHMAGDELIIAVSRLITEEFGNTGFLSRVGGDEFAVISQGMSVLEMESCLEELRKKLDDYNENSATLKISLSSGYSFHQDGLVNTSLLFREADNNMYQSKLLKAESTRSDLVKTLMKALEAKDFITEGHAERMEELAVKIGEVLMLPRLQMDRIRLLSKFHDIGKVGIPDSILNKPSRLTPDEWNVMKSHCSIGQRIASESAELREIAPLILKHHEKWDGSGYPIGLKEEDIPVECRIISIVDTFDAMTNDRPYRKALPQEDAIKEIVLCSGTQFDPGLVEVFIQAVSK